MDAAPIVVDGLMCEDIRVGIAVRQAFTSAGRGVSLMYRRKGGNGPDISFSSALIDQAGGFQRFLDEWDRVEETLVDERWVAKVVPMMASVPVSRAEEVTKPIPTYFTPIDACPSCGAMGKLAASGLCPDSWHAGGGGGG